MEIPKKNRTQWSLGSSLLTIGIGGVLMCAFVVLVFSRLGR